MVKDIHLPNDIEIWSMCVVDWIIFESQQIVERYRVRVLRADIPCYNINADINMKTEEKDENKLEKMLLKIDY